MRPLRLALLAAAFALTPALEAQETVYVKTPPPAPLADVRTDQPSPAAVWQPGYYSWVGDAWLWNHGSWAVPPKGMHEWEQAKWVEGGPGWYLVPGHWK